MPDMDPVDRLSLAQRLGQAIQAVTNHAEDALYPGLGQCFGDEVGDIFNCHDGLSFSGHLKIDARRRRNAHIMFGATRPRKAIARPK
jgi:hypothetical protein